MVNFQFYLVITNLPLPVMHFPILSTVLLFEVTKRVEMFCHEAENRIEGRENNKSKLLYKHDFVAVAKTLSSPLI